MKKPVVSIENVRVIPATRHTVIWADRHVAEAIEATRKTIIEALVADKVGRHTIELVWNEFAGLILLTNNRRKLTGEVAKTSTKRASAKREATADQWRETSEKLFRELRDKNPRVKLTEAARTIKDKVYKSYDTVHIHLKKKFGSNKKKKVG